MDPWDEMDDWCKRQSDYLNEVAEGMIRRGAQPDDPSYLKVFGQSMAFGTMRSYIHGARAIESGSHRKEG